VAVNVDAAVWVHRCAVVAAWAWQQVWYVRSLGVCCVYDSLTTSACGFVAICLYEYMHVCMYVYMWLCDGG